MSATSTRKFIRWWVHQLRTFDCDPAIVAMKYIINRMELNTEQRYWFCFLYANTYHLPTAWVLFNEFPDYENVPLGRIERFSREHAARLPYQKDQKWLRARLGDTFKSYRANLKTLTQDHYFKTFSEAIPDSQDRFTVLWEHILKDFYLFGRYTAWFYLQSLKEVCGLPIQPTSLMLDFDASKTHRAGLCYAQGNPGTAEKGHKFDKLDFISMDTWAENVLRYVSSVEELQLLPVKPDYFSMETALCSFKKLHRRKQGRYLGYYHDRFALDIERADAAGWPGINWQLFWDFRTECLVPEVQGGFELNQWQQDIYLTTDGELFHGDQDFMGTLDLWLNERLP